MLDRHGEVLAPLLLGVIVAVAGPVPAQEGEWRVGGRLLAVETDAETEPMAYLDSRIAFGGARTAEFDATYMLSRELGLEWMITTAPHRLAAAEGTLDGVDLGKVWIAETTVTLRYELPIRGPWSPYLGLGVGGAFLHSSDPSAAAIEEVTSDVLYGWVGQLGLAYAHGRDWILSLDVKRAVFSGDVEIKSAGGDTNGQLEVDLDPWLVGLGAAYRF